jgi:hypothetical protein
MKIKEILNRLERSIVNQGRIVDWENLRDMVNNATGSELPASKLDTATQQLVNRLHKKADYLLKR